ncbi:chaperonin GroEL [bacterium]|nr:chaperonin GroEL [bacterium]
MAAKEIHFRDAARHKLLSGATLLHDAIRITLGPKSKCVLIARSYGKPLVCNDGVTIAKEFELKDPQENLGVQIMRDAAEKTGEAVGDGTSTSTLLAYRIFAEGLRNVIAGASAIDIKRGLERGLKIAIQKIQSLSRPIESKMEMAQVATISAHNDPRIGELVADAMERVGPEGAVSVEEAKGTETVLEVVEGMQFDRGYSSPYFVTDPESMEVVLDNALVLLYEKRLASVKDLMPILNEVSQSGQAFLIIAEEVEGEALATLVLNKMRGVLNCATVKAPGFGDRRKAMMEDLAIVTGGRFIAEELGLKLENLDLTCLGRAQRITLNKDTTTVVGGAGDKAKIQGRCNEIRKQIALTTSDYDREKLEERLAKLAGGVAVIRVGAASEAEMKNLKEAFDDAISATKAATAEGIVPGCGLTLLRAIDALNEAEKDFEGDERTAIRILKRALEEPTRQIAVNSEVDEGVVIHLMRSGQGNYGFDGSNGEYGDLMSRGIIDPTKVVRVGLENAVSVAATLLLTEATMTNVPEPKVDPPMRPGMGDF